MNMPKTGAGNKEGAERRIRTAYSEKEQDERAARDERST